MGPEDDSDPVSGGQGSGHGGNGGGSGDDPRHSSLDAALRRLFRLYGHPSHLPYRWFELARSIGRAQERLRQRGDSDGSRGGDGST